MGVDGKRYFGNLVDENIEKTLKALGDPRENMKSRKFLAQAAL
jgi:hypothetical protein